MIKVKDIVEMDIYIFLEHLNLINFDFVENNYISYNAAFNIYQEEALISNQDEYLTPNEFFDLARKAKEEYK